MRFQSGNVDLTRAIIRNGEGQVESRGSIPLSVRTATDVWNESTQRSRNEGLNEGESRRFEVTSGRVSVEGDVDGGPQVEFQELTSMSGHVF